jgi:hypothetical protein
MTMRRAMTVAAACLAIAACSKAPDANDAASSDSGPDLGGRAAAGVAFTYAYSLVMPGDDIADVQETHASACERLGPDRCRITGLHYTVGSSGRIDADLAMTVAAPIARRFGREGVLAAEKAGAVLAGVTIGGTEVATQAAADTQAATEATGERARVQADLRRTQTAAARAELLRRDTELAAQARTARADAAAARESIANTPVSFDYSSGRGAGLANRVREAGDAAAASTAVTLATLLTALATLGPPLILILLLVVVWRRWGHRAWRRIAGPDDPYAPRAPRADPPAS